MSVGVIGGFFRWWVSELKDLLPAGRRMSRRRGRCLVLLPSDTSVRALIEGRGRREVVEQLGGRDGLPLAALASTYSSLPGHLRRLPVVIRVNASDCHERVVILPAKARKDFSRLLRLDLEHATPLKSDDLLSTYVVEGAHADSGMVRVRHLLLKRRRIDPLIEALSTAGVKPVSIECSSSDGASISGADFMSAPGPEVSSAWRPAAAALAVIAVVLGLSAVGIHWGKREQALSALAAENVRLDAEVDEARQAVETASVSLTKLRRVQRLVEGRASTLRIVEEVTRLVPDTAWLEELRIDGDVVEIAGLAASATALLPAFERSPLFHESRFTAPLQRDQATDRERFRLRVRLRPAVQADVGRRAELTR